MQTSNLELRCHAYFEQFLSDKVGQRLLPDLESLTSSFSCQLDACPEIPWRVAIVDGALAEVVQTDRPAACCFACDASTFLDIVSGALRPQEAFFSGRVDISGDLESGLMLSAVLAPFFAAHPYAQE